METNNILETIDKKLDLIFEEQKLIRAAENALSANKLMLLEINSIYPFICDEEKNKIQLIFKDLKEVKYNDVERIVKINENLKEIINNFNKLCAENGHTYILTGIREEEKAGCVIKCLKCSSIKAVKLSDLRKLNVVYDVDSKKRIRKLDFKQERKKLISNDKKN